MASHKHRWIELGRVLPFSDRDRDLDYLSPEGLHDPETGALVAAADTKGKLRALFESKVPEPTPHIILQCADPGCPDGPKHTVHVDLHRGEWERLRDAYGRGALDPDANGTNRLVSQASLGELGLERVEKMLADPHASGARETIEGIV